MARAGKAAHVERGRTGRALFVRRVFYGIYFSDGLNELHCRWTTRALEQKGDYIGEKATVLKRVFISNTGVFINVDLASRIVAAVGFFAFRLAECVSLSKYFTTLSKRKNSKLAKTSERV